MQIEAKKIKAIYRAGSMLYEIKDPLLNKGIIYLHAIALYSSEGFIVKLSAENIPATVQLIAAYGGATGKKFSRDGDIGADPESSFYLKPEYCKDNIFKIKQNSFQLLYGFAKPLTEEEQGGTTPEPGAVATVAEVLAPEGVRGAAPRGLGQDGRRDDAGEQRGLRPEEQPRHLVAPELTDGLIDAVVDGTSKQLGSHSIADLERYRDDCLMARLEVFRPGALLVHRLDCDTSGVMVFALTKAAQGNLGLAYDRQGGDQMLQWAFHVQQHQHEAAHHGLQAGHDLGVERGGRRVGSHRCRRGL